MKLAALIGLMMSFPQAIITLFSGITLEGLAAIILLLLKTKGRREEMPNTFFLSLGALAVLLGEQYFLFLILKGD